MFLLQQFFIHYQWSIHIFLSLEIVIISWFISGSTSSEQIFANWLLLFHKWGGFNTLNNPWMHLWGFYVTPLSLYFCLPSLSLSGQPVSSATAQVYMPQPNRQNAAFCSVSCHRSTVHPFFFLRANACQRLITTGRIMSFRSVKRQRDVCWHLWAPYSIFTSSVTIAAWAWGYCHAVAMTSGIHKKILVGKKGWGGCWQKHIYTSPRIKDAQRHTHIWSKGR